MKIGVLFNCQSDGLAASLAALLPDDCVHGFMLKQVVAGEPRERAAATLAGCARILAWEFLPRTGPLSIVALRQSGATVHVLPSFQFAGFHPDMVYLPVGNTCLNSPTGRHHSRIAVAGFLAGLTPEATAALYNRLVFARLGYFGVFAEQRGLLSQSLSARGLPGEALLDSAARTGCFMHSHNHPKIGVLLDVARAACGLMQLPTMPVDAEALPDDLARAPSHPVFPDIAWATKVAPEGAFRDRAPDGRTVLPMDAETFVTRCFEIYARTPRAALLKVDGAARAAAILAGG